MLQLTPPILTLRVASHLILLVISKAEVTPTEVRGAKAKAKVLLLRMKLFIKAKRYRYVSFAAFTSQDFFYDSTCYLEWVILTSLVCC